MACASIWRNRDIAAISPIPAKTKQKATASVPATKQKRKPGRPKAEPDRDKRQDLLTAALHAFGSRGFDGVSLGQIAGDAGVDIALTRYYFGSKDALWRAVIDHLSQTLAGELQERLSSVEGSATDRMKAVIRWFVDISARVPELSRIIVFEGNNEGSRGDYVTSHLVQPFYALMAELIAGAQAEGTIGDIAPRTLFFMITHGGSFPMALPALTNAFPGGNISDAKALDAHADTIISLIFKDG